MEVSISLSVGVALAFGWLFLYLLFNLESELMGFPGGVELLVAVGSVHPRLDRVVEEHLGHAGVHLGAHGHTHRHALRGSGRRSGSGIALRH